MLRRLLLLVATLGMVVGVAACGGDAGGSGAGAEANEVIGDADEGIEGVQAIRVPDNDHTEGTVAYGLQPAAGGKHHPVWVNCGFHDESFPDEHLVHDLEHGAVWLAYSPELAAPDVEVIHELARQHPKVVATPYADLESGVAVVATAWARQLTLDSVDDSRLEDFVVQYQDGSQAPEAGVPCTGTPLGDPIP